MEIGGIVGVGVGIVGGDDCGDDAHAGRDRDVGLCTNSG